MRFAQRARNAPFSPRYHRIRVEGINDEGINGEGVNNEG